MINTHHDSINLTLLTIITQRICYNTISDTVEHCIINISKKVYEKQIYIGILLNLHCTLSHFQVHCKDFYTSQCIYMQMYI